MCFEKCKHSRVIIIYSRALYYSLYSFHVFHTERSIYLLRHMEAFSNMLVVSCCRSRCCLMLLLFVPSYSFPLMVAANSSAVLGKIIPAQGE